MVVFLSKELLVKELMPVSEVVEFACGIASELKGEYVEHVSTGMDTYSIRQPLGVRPTSAWHTKRWRSCCRQYP